MCIEGEKKTSLVNILTMLKDHLTYNQYNFISNIVKNHQRVPSGRRWALLDKSLAMNIYHRSSSAYRALSRLLDLPSVSTLRRSISGIANQPGFCPILLKSLKAATRKMNEQDKMCILCFDEMNIKSGLRYNQKYDIIMGYEDFGSISNSSRKFATHALVFMIRDIYKQWKQIIGYFFSSNNSPASILKQTINLSSY